MDGSKPTGIQLCWLSSQFTEIFCAAIALAKKLEDALKAVHEQGILSVRDQVARSGLV
jgi:hypothetical protein